MISNLNAPVTRSLTALSELASPSIEQINEYWLSKAAGRDMPCWDAVDPADFPRLLPLVAVGGIEWTPFRVFFRLAGSSVEALRGNLTGRYLDEASQLDHGTRSQMLAEFGTCARERRPLFILERVGVRDGTEHIVTIAIFPFSPEGGPVDRCLLVEDCGGLSPSRIALARS